MADFSFSFDSDNPFAEPEQAPKKVPVSDESVAGAPNSAADAEIPASSADNVGNASDDFLLDSFDFAFGEDDAINDSLPTRNTPDYEAPSRQLTPGEAAFAEYDFNAAQNEKSALVEVPVAESAAEVPVAEAPVAELAVAEAPIASAADTAEISVPDFTAFESEVLEESESAGDLPFAPIEAASPEFEVSVGETSALEASQEVAASDKESQRSKLSDLEEFNAFTYDFGMPNDELFGSEVEAVETDSAVSDKEEVTVKEEPAPVMPLDFLVPDASVEKAEFVVVEPNLTEINAEKIERETPEIEAFDSAENIAEVAATPPRISTHISAEDASLPDSSEDEPTAFEPVASAQVEDAIVGDVMDEAAVAEVAMVEPMLIGSEAQTEGEFRRLRTKATLKVAVLGASGIGRNHARWFHNHGCEIVGFLGTSPETTTQTESDLTADFTFQGNAYTELETLLQTEKPDIVCVATPPPLHFSHVLQSLEAGAHVLCEKPLVYAPTRKFRENRDGAKELVKVAAKRKLNLGTQLQYGGATPILCKLAGLTPNDVGDFAMELETKNPNAPRDPRELWIDLGPHPISVAQMLAGPGGQLAEDSIRFEPYQDDEKTEVLARFGINCADGRLLMVRAVVRALNGETARKPRRRFSFNGHAVTYAPLQSIKNGFQAQFVAPDGYASVYPDPVDYLIGNFINACRNGEAPMIGGDFGRENLEWMLKVAMPGEAK